MSDHLSDLTLDEVAAGAPPPTHLEACAPCRSRLEQVRAHAAHARTRPGFMQVRSAVLTHAARERGMGRPRATWHARWVLVPALAAAVAGLVVTQGRVAGSEAEPAPVPGLREKGGAGVELLRLADGAVNPVLRAGDRVALRLRGSGARYAWVVSADAAGKVEPLWPAPGRGSGALSAEEGAPVFQVTEGDFTVHAFFSDTPLTHAQVQRWLAALPSGCAREVRRPGCLEVPGLPTDIRHAAVALVVEARR